LLQVFAEAGGEVQAGGIQDPSFQNKEEESYLPGWFDTGAKEAGRPAAKKDAQQRGIEQR